MGTDPEPTWHEIVDPLAARFEIGAKFNASVVHNPEGAAAIADVLRKMARIIDREIDNRSGGN